MSKPELSSIRKLSKRLDVRTALRNWIADMDRNRANQHYASQTCDENANIREMLSGKQLLNGQIGVIEQGMDCDCSSYHREYLRPMFTSVAQYKHWANKQYENAEGPHSIFIVDAHSIDRSRNASRDLALEAFENGHQHTVYYHD